MGFRCASVMKYVIMSLFRHGGSKPPPYTVKIGLQAIYESPLQNKNASVPLARDKGENYLCGTTLVPDYPALEGALSGAPGTAYLVRCAARR